MKFEKLNDNKIKIILNIKDLEEKNIDFHSFMSNSIESQDLFIEILKQAEKEIGFITNNYNIHIEAFATSDGDFIFTITRISSINLPKKKKIIYRRKTQNIDKKLSIYSFYSFEDYCNFCTFLKKHFTNSNIFFKNTSLILYNSNYYLLLNDIVASTSITKRFFAYISEFANLCNSSNLSANILAEHGEKLIPENAIEIGMSYFG